jgi:hypothetical protein
MNKSSRMSQLGSPNSPLSKTRSRRLRSAYKACAAARGVQSVLTSAPRRASATTEHRSFKLVRRPEDVAQLRLVLFALTRADPFVQLTDYDQAGSAP